MTFWHFSCYSDIPKAIRLSTNCMTMIPGLTFTELRVVSMDRLQRVWHASRERLPFRTPGSVPLFGTCLCPNCWDQFSRTCRVSSRLFTLKTPRYFLDFAFRSLYTSNLKTILTVFNVTSFNVTETYILNLKFFFDFPRKNNENNW